MWGLWAALAAALCASVAADIEVSRSIAELELGEVLIKLDGGCGKTDKYGCAEWKTDFGKTVSGSVHAALTHDLGPKAHFVANVQIKTGELLLGRYAMPGVRQGPDAAVRRVRVRVRRRVSDPVQAAMQPVRRGVLVQDPDPVQGCVYPAAALPHVGLVSRHAGVPHLACHARARVDLLH